MLFHCSMTHTMLGATQCYIWLQFSTMIMRYSVKYCALVLLLDFRAKLNAVQLNAYKAESCKYIHFLNH